MIRFSNFADIQAIDELEDLTNLMNAVNQDILEEVHEELEPEILADMKEEPGKVRYPIQWTSDEQRRYVMWKLRKENNLPYRRTGKLAEAWVVEIRGNAIVIENPASAAKYVYGSLAQNRSAAMRFKQRFHSNTGWYTAHDRVIDWMDEIQKLYLKKFDAKLSDYAKSTGGRRAYTKGTRRR